MKRLFLAIVFLLPMVIWADPQPKAGERLVLLLALMKAPGTGILTPCEWPVAGVGVVQNGPNRVTAGDSVVLVAVATDASYSPISSTNRIRIGVLGSEKIPFLSGDIYTNQPWDTLTLGPNIYFPGWSGAGNVVKAWRATTHQRGVSPEITEYRFIAEDISGTFLPDTSSPLDSVIPGPLYYLVLVLPGETHYPGDITLNKLGKRGVRIDWDANRFYDCWAYATDVVYNAVPYPATNMSVWLSPCQTTLNPDSVNPAIGVLFTEVPHNGVIDSVAKGLYQVRYATTGYAGLISSSFAGTETQCERFRVTGPPPDPKDKIVVIPNPCGTPGLPAVITIKRVPLGGGFIRGKIFDSFGYLVRDFSQELMDQYKADPLAAAWIINWDATNGKGEQVSNGCYHLCVEIMQAEEESVFKEKIGVIW
ncbi:MAG: hypothetical protein HY769_05500 [Candidatus Stahlbacteria bacterium]|nr:hypothetical protein [Candidatus Stahlbacteria bacterium]